MRWFIGSDNTLWVLNLRDAVTQANVNAATITAVIYNPDGSVFATVSGFTSAGTNLTINGVTHAAGNFSAQLPAATAAMLVKGTDYKALFTVVADGQTLVIEGCAPAGYLGDVNQ